MDSKKKQGDAHGSPSHVQSGTTWDPLAAASHQVGPNGDTTWGTLLQTKRRRYPKKVENTSEIGILDFGLVAKGSHFILGVWGLGRVRSTPLSRPQPFATVRDEDAMAVPTEIAAKVVCLEVLNGAYNFVSCSRLGTS